MDGPSQLERHGGKAKHLARAERRHKMLELVKAGNSYTEIGEIMGCHRTTVREVVEAAYRQMRALDEETVESLRSRDLLALAEMQKQLWPRIEVKQPFFFCEGCGESSDEAKFTHADSCQREPYFWCEGCSEQGATAKEVPCACEGKARVKSYRPPAVVYVNPVPDDKAYQALLKIMERRSKLAGVDAAAKPQPVSGEGEGPNIFLVDKDELERIEKRWRARGHDVESEAEEVRGLPTEAS
jgi:hypothetical protein